MRVGSDSGFEWEKGRNLTSWWYNYECEVELNY